jgi:molybdenum cofactor cytidylyltransferase
MIDRVEGIILAAGLSRRMGRQKLLIHIGEQTLIYRVAASAVESQLGSVTIVTGPRADDLLAELDFSDGYTKLRHVVNRNPEQGMSSSLRTGIQSVAEQTDAAMIILADQPGLTSNVINELILAYHEHPQHIIVPTINNRRTTPVIFPRSLFQELVAVSGDIGGRSVVNANPDLVVSVELALIYNDADLDTPDDVRAFTNATHKKR